MRAIDYGLSNVMMPLALIGAQVGAFVYLTFPVLIINVLLTVLLIWLWLKSLFKAISMVKSEKAAKEKDNLEANLVCNEDGQCCNEL